MDGTETDDGYCYALNSAVTTPTTVGGDDQCYRGTYTGSTQTLTTVTLVLNYYANDDPTVYVQLYDLSADGATIAETPEDGVAIDIGGSCDAPLTVTIPLTVTNGAQAVSGHQFELDITYSGVEEGYWTVLGNEPCDPAADTQLDLGFQAVSSSTPGNVCQLGITCYMAFAVFNVQTATGAPVGGATVVVSANDIPSQTGTTAAAASTSLLCTESPAWTAEWGVAGVASQGRPGSSP